MCKVRINPQKSVASIVVNCDQACSKSKINLYWSPGFRYYFCRLNALYTKFYENHSISFRFVGSIQNGFHLLFDVTYKKKFVTKCKYKEKRTNKRTNNNTLQEFFNWQTECLRIFSCVYLFVCLVLFFLVFAKKSDMNSKWTKKYYILLF